MEVTQGSLVIVGSNTPDMKVYFNGTQIEGVKDLTLNWDPVSPRVTLTLNETSQVQELKQSGISVRRAA
jgi:hypothetical protein